MNMKNCLLVFAIAIILFSIGFQAAILLPASAALEAFVNAIILDASDGGITPNGGGGDPVPGPGIPK
ncbi:MAG: hypothetical protein QXM22_00110 [Candidatus Bathyarchaeia archaeon]